VVRAIAELGLKTAEDAEDAEDFREKPALPFVAVLSDPPNGCKMMKI